MNISDFDFNLPEELIALRPVRPRSAARLLVSERQDITDSTFFCLDTYLKPGDRLVINNTKVICARLKGHRRRLSDQGETFATVEITLLSCNTDGHWVSMAKPARRLRVGEDIIFNADLQARVLSKSSDSILLSFNKIGQAFDTALAHAGSMPLPPYIATKRDVDARDTIDYQTTFAKEAGAVAAPTAALHFDADLLARLKAKGVLFSEITLHVGAGTFLPVKVDDISHHKMHAEHGYISEKAAQDIAETKKQGGRVIAVGTTVLRLIETAARKTGYIQPWAGETDIFITPGFPFYIADGLITNFHLPKSTLLMLVAAFVGYGRMRQIYAHAICKKYRFFSYGDGSLLFPT